MNLTTNFDLVDMLTLSTIVCFICAFDMLTLEAIDSLTTCFESLKECSPCSIVSSKPICRRTCFDPMSVPYEAVPNKMTIHLRTHMRISSSQSSIESVTIYSFIVSSVNS